MTLRGRSRSAVGDIVAHRDSFLDEATNRFLLLVEIKERKTGYDFITSGKTFTFFIFENGECFSIFISGDNEEIIQEKFHKMFVSICSE